MKHTVLTADQLNFRITGPYPQRFINLAVQQGIHLAHLHWEKDGFSAQSSGVNVPRLRRLAEKGGWDFAVVTRRGPGIAAEWFLARPGIPVGILLFLVLVQLFGRFVWAIDFGSLDASMQERMRTLLSGCHIFEGVLLHKEDLDLAQSMALQQSDLFGWISLNFADGTLSIEHTPAQEQSIREEPAMAPLYAKASGRILAVEAESGFALVTPGQNVEVGQLLVDNKRLDRDGREILQGASGRVEAYCEKTYSAVQNLAEEKTFLTGQSFVRNTLNIAGVSRMFGVLSLPESIQVYTEWIPLQLGRLNLPASLCRQTVWEQTSALLRYSPEQALALAQRNCRAQLFSEFPDAQIEAERCESQSTGDSIQCSITYRFCANIATGEVPSAQQ